MNPNVSLAAAVQLSNLVEYHWKFADETHAKSISIEGFDFIIISEEDKSAVRSTIVAKMYECENQQIIKQYTRCLTTIARIDYPQKWPTLLDQDILNALNSQNDKGILTGLLALFGLTKKYEYELEEDRDPLFVILQKVFDVLGNLINQVIEHSDNEVALKILHLITKVFYVSNQLQIAPFLTAEGALDPWIAFFKNLLDRPVPAELDNFVEDMDSIAARDKSLHWKIKGMAAKITYRLFSKYGNLKYVHKDDEAFSNMFFNKFAETLLESHLTMMFRRKTNFVGSKTLNFVIKFVTAGTTIQQTMDKLKPFIENILYETVIPIMLVTHRDVTLFSEDPIEYIRKQQDFTETLYMPKHTVVDLLIYICSYSSQNADGGKRKKGQKPDYLFPFLNYVSENLQQYAQQIAQGANPDWRVKEALLYAVGSLKDQIENQAELNAQMEPMLTNHVLCELKSTQPFLKSRACWLYGEFGDFSFTDKDHVKQAVDGVYQALFVEELPVKLSAATAMSRLLRNDTAEEFLKPALKNILEVYLKIMSEVDSEELVSALEEIMAVYRDDIGPYAVQIAEQLVAQYKRLIGVDPEDDDGESALAAVGVVTALRRIIDAVSKDKQILKALQDIIYPILMHGLTPDGLDAIEDGLDCIALLIYHTCDNGAGMVSPEMWKLFPQMLYIVGGKDDDVDGGFAFEYLPQVAVAVQNYISKDPQTFLSVGPDQEVSYLELTFKFLQRVLVVNSNGNSKLDGIVAMKVIIAILDNLPGRIDTALPHLIGMLLAEHKMQIESEHPQQKYLSMILQALTMSFYNNSAATFAIFEQNQQTAVVFGSLLNFMSKFKHEFELRRVIFGLCSILRTPVGSIPPFVVEKLAYIVQQIAYLSSRVKAARVKMLEENEKVVARGTLDFDEDEMDDDEEEVNEAEEKEIQEKLAKARAEGKNDDDFEDESESDSDYEFQAGDLNLYDSALDDADELIFVKETLDTIH